jgi:predicted nucleotidyltransferase
MVCGYEIGNKVLLKMIAWEDKREKELKEKCCNLFYVLHFYPLSQKIPSLTKSLNFWHNI